MEVMLSAEDRIEDAEIIHHHAHRPCRWTPSAFGRAVRAFFVFVRWRARVLAAVTRA